jgi:hypothetical protein
MAHAGAQSPAGERRPDAQSLIDSLEVPETGWIATAWLQQMPDAAVPLLLQPGKAWYGHHMRWTTRMLALAKIGEPAVPAIVERARVILRSGQAARGEIGPLIEVLGAIGPRAIPALVEIAESESVARSALDEIVRLDPRTRRLFWGSTPWRLWRPADDRPGEIERELTPRLPRIRQILTRAIEAPRRSDSGPEGPAAYLLARWGTADDRALGLRVLDDLARSRVSFDFPTSPIRLLYALDAPQTPSVIRDVARRMPGDNGQRESRLLQLARMLEQLGDRDYAPVLEVPLRGKPDLRADVARFIATTGELTDASLLLPLLDDPDSESNGKMVAAAALQALRDLTLEDLPLDAGAWRDWVARNGRKTRAELVARRVEVYLRSVRAVPIWEVNRWFDRFTAKDGAALFPLIDTYLARRDADPSAAGRGSLGLRTFRVSSEDDQVPGSGSPHIVTLLLEMTQRGIPGAQERILACLRAADRDVRIYGALALAAVDRARAADQLAIETKGSLYGQAATFLLLLGDPRGIPNRLERLTARDGLTFRYACRDLRIYTQQPLPCDPADGDPKAIAAAWTGWWTRHANAPPLKVREARLDMMRDSPARPVRVGDMRVK